MQELLGFFSSWVIYAYILLLNAFLPGRWVTGYATQEGSDEKLRYCLNGFLVLIISVATWAGLCYLGWVPWDFLYQVRWYGLLGAIVLGLLFSWLVVRPYPPVHHSYFKDFFLGRVLNLQWRNGKVDAKMWLYLIGAILLELNVLSFVAHHYTTYHEAGLNYGIFVAAGLLTYFICDYLTFEEVHLYTYDLFAERVGFKLGWGCIAFYPYFYMIPLWQPVDMTNPNQGTLWLIFSAAIFFFGWGLSRGANLQKYYFKRNPKQNFLGITPESITDGKKTLLVNGYWGLSRHINYLGEIGMATGIVLAVGHPMTIWPWFYPLYYVLLLFPRQIDDDKRCAQKYGPLWDEYVKKVPYRIIPYIY